MATDQSTVIVPELQDGFDDDDLSKLREGTYTTLDNEHRAQQLDLSACLNETFDASRVRRVDMSPESRDAFLVYSILTENECQRLIAATEKIGYGKTNYRFSYRGNARLIIDDNAFGKALGERLRPFVPETVTTAVVGNIWTVSGCESRRYSGLRHL